jgi:hypothetical protein
MNVRMFLSAGLAWAVTSGLCAAQGDRPVDPNSGSKAGHSAKPASDQTKRNYELYEDIEIMSRILKRTLSSLSGPTLKGNVHDLSAGAFSPDGKLLAVNAGDNRGEIRLFKAADGQQFLWSANPSDPWSATCQEVDGIYLKNYGVVFSVTIPVKSVESVHGAIQAPAPAQSDWERARSDLRGEAREVKGKTAGPEPISLTDALLKVLAENGRHFSQLGGEECLTIAVTLRTPATASKLDQAQLEMPGPFETQQAGSNEPLSQYKRYLTASQGYGATPYTTGAGAQYSATYNIAGAQNGEPQAKDAVALLRQSASNYVHLGEMRLKQGRIRESADAYAEAAASYQKMIESIKAEMGGERWKEKLAAASEAADALTKLAQAYLLLGEKDRATQTIERAAELTGWAVSGKSEAKTKGKSQSSRIPLPGRLIISVPRALLEHVATGKISFEDFKKEADIQYFHVAG